LIQTQTGGRFATHTDGRRLADLNTQSVNIYLNTVPSSSGSATHVLVALSPSDLSGKHDFKFEELGKAHPVLGTAAVFRDFI